METVRLGASGVEASKIGLGTWAIGGWCWGGTDEAESIRTIHAALDRGVTLIDTAPVYGQGRSEEIVGRALEGRRDRAVVGTKLGLDWDAHGNPFRDSRPERVAIEIEASLRRLRTDRIDLYQVHWPDPKTPIEATADALRKLLEAGKIRAIGVSNFSPAQLDAWRAVAPLHAVQPPYNLFERQIEADVLPYAKKHGLAVLAYGAICRGLLSGRMREGTRFGGDDIRSHDPKFQPPRFAQYLAAVGAIEALARAHGKSVLAYAVRWVIDQGAIALWGARRPDQLAPVDEVFGWSIPEDERERLDAILARTVKDPVGPEFMAPPAR